MRKGSEGKEKYKGREREREYNRIEQIAPWYFIERRYSYHGNKLRWYQNRPTFQHSPLSVRINDIDIRRWTVSYRFQIFFCFPRFSRVLAKCLLSSVMDRKKIYLSIIDNNLLLFYLISFILDSRIVYIYIFSPPHFRYVFQRTKHVCCALKMSLRFLIDRSIIFDLINTR